MAPVLIVGAGPTGLAVACGLLAAGVDVVIADAADGPVRTSRALGVQPRGVEVLDRLGALADLPERSVHMAGTVIHVHGREKMRLRVPPGEVLGGRSALIISQAEIEAQLRTRLAELGGSIEWGREVTGARQHPDGVTASFGDCATARYDWLVGGDGAGSRVRKSTGIRLVGDTGPERYLLADVQVDLPVERSYASMWAGAGGSLAALPLPGQDRWRLMAPAPSGATDDVPPRTRSGAVHQRSA